MASHPAKAAALHGHAEVPSLTVGAALMGVVGLTVRVPADKHGVANPLRISRLTPVYSLYILRLKSDKELMRMYATIQRWGNSQGIRIPKVLLESLHIQENDRVELVQTEDAITIRKISASTHKTLEERLTAFYGQPIEKIGRIGDCPEVDWGKAEGSEAW